MKKYILIILVLALTACTPAKIQNEPTNVQDLPPVTVQEATLKEWFNAQDFDKILNEISFDDLKIMGEDAKWQYIHAAMANQAFDQALKMMDALSLDAMPLYDLYQNKLLIADYDALYKALLIYQPSYEDDPYYQLVMSFTTYIAKTPYEGTLLLEKSHAKHPSHHETIEHLLSMKEQESMKRGLSFLDEVAEKNNEPAYVASLKARVYSNQSFYTEAMHEMAKAYTLEPQTYSEDYMLACFSAHRYIKMYAVYTSHPEITYDDETLNALIFSLVDRDAFDEARALIASQQEKDPTRALWYLQELELLLRQGAYDTFEEVLTRAETNGVSPEDLKKQFGYTNWSDTPVEEWLTEVFQTYYLYEPGQLPDDLVFTGDREKDARLAFEALKKDDDRFTFLISKDEGFNTDGERQFLLEDQVIYVKFPVFDAVVDDWLIASLDKVPASDQQILILDLRNNPGGLLSSANAILDELLSYAITLYQIDQNGYQTPFYSNPSKRFFKEIVILLNEGSASSSEVIALALKKRLSNVTLMGQTSYGKGVGQSLFYDKVSGLSLYIVNFYWNVIEENIHDKGIVPDVKVTFDPTRPLIPQVLAQLQE